MGYNRPGLLDMTGIKFSQDWDTPLTIATTEYLHCLIKVRGCSVMRYWIVHCQERKAIRVLHAGKDLNILPRIRQVLDLDQVDVYSILGCASSEYERKATVLQECTSLACTIDTLTTSQ